MYNQAAVESCMQSKVLRLSGNGLAAHMQHVLEVPNLRMQGKSVKASLAYRPHLPLLQVGELPVACSELRPAIARPLCICVLLHTLFPSLRRPRPPWAHGGLPPVEGPRRAPLPRKLRGWRPLLLLL